MKRVEKIFLMLYLLLLGWGILFKFQIQLMIFTYGYRYFNVIPYQDLARTVQGDIEWREILFNILAFLPFGFFLRRNRLVAVLLAGVSLSLAFEIVQFTLAIGMFDITDIIHNALGTMTGYYLGKEVWACLKR